MDNRPAWQRLGLSKDPELEVAALDARAKDELSPATQVIARVAWATQILLYVLFAIDCLVLLYASVGSRSWFPAGGGSLIVILGLIGGLRAARERWLGVAHNFL